MSLFVYLFYVCKIDFKVPFNLILFKLISLCLEQCIFEVVDFQNDKCFFNNIMKCDINNIIGNFFIL